MTGSASTHITDDLVNIAEVHGGTRSRTFVVVYKDGTGMAWGDSRYGGSATKVDLACCISKVGDG